MIISIYMNIYTYICILISIARSETLLQVTRTTNMINEGEEYAPHVS